MVDIESIKTYYSTASTIELVELSKKPQQLRKEIVPILKAELEKRKETIAVEELDNLLSAKPISAGFVVERINRNDVLDEISNRISNGESIESIRIDLHERGIDITELFNENGMYSESKFNERLIQEIMERRVKGEDYDKIKDDIAAREGFTKDETEVLVNETHARGRKNMERGAIVFFIGCAVTCFTYLMSAEKGGFVIVAYGAIISGIVQFVHGVRQTKDHND